MKRRLNKNTHGLKSKILLATAVLATTALTLSVAQASNASNLNQTSSPKAAIKASEWQRVDGKNLVIYNPTKKIDLVTIFNSNVCPSNIFLGLRGSGEGFLTVSNKLSGKKVTVGNQKFDSYIDDPKSGSTIGKTSQGIGQSLGKIYETLNSAPNSTFKRNISSAAPALSSLWSYQPPPIMPAITGGTDATFNFMLSMFDTGIANTEMSLVAISYACPNSKIILAGYSQGAFIVSAALNDLRGKYGAQNGDQILPRISAAIVLADPANPKDGLIPFVKNLVNNPVLAGTFKYGGSLVGKVGVGFAQSMAAMVIMGDIYNHALDGNNLANISTLTAVSTKASQKLPALPVYSVFKRGDIVACGNPILTNPLQWVPEIGPGINIHSNYYKDTWASDQLSVLWKTGTTTPFKASTC